ncbi:hypothetical protein JXA88_19020, partial [Candidatus Fermentibacteria bacterium]|nr:hypothetical protein [Candidatus Fermentibacteria bacterium]
FIGGDPNPYGPEIELKGAGPGNGASIAISRASHVAVKGLCINGFDASLISIAGSLPGSGEVTTDITVTGCYLGIDPTGTGCGSQSGCGLSAYHVVGLRIGGDSQIERNIISCAGNKYLSLAYCGDVEIVNNIIGTDRTGTVDLLSAPLGGVHLSHTVRPALFRDNQVCSAYWDLVNISHTDPDSGQVRVINNRLGEGVDGTPMSAIDGVEVRYSPGHFFKENVIAHSRVWYGMYLHGDPTDYVTITRNSIYDCSHLGINLGNRNCTDQGVDLIDGAYGPGVNEEIDPCYCDSIVNRDDGGGGETMAFFTCMRDCTVEVFIGDHPGVWALCPLSGHGKVYSGKTYLGDAREVMAGPVFSTYRFAVSPALPEGTVLTSTATNGNGSTSEFGCTCQVPLAGESARGCLPSAYRFFPPAPNPCSDGAAIRFHLPKACPVRINVYDSAGRDVARVAGARFEAGVHGLWWRAQDTRGRPLPSGSYVVRMETDEFVSSQQVMVVR